MHCLDLNYTVYCIVKMANLLNPRSKYEGFSPSDQKGDMIVSVGSLLHSTIIQVRTFYAHIVFFITRSLFIPKKGKYISMNPQEWVEVGDQNIFQLWFTHMQQQAQIHMLYRLFFSISISEEKVMDEETILKRYTCP